MDESASEQISGEETDRAWQAMLDGRYPEALQMWDTIVKRDSEVGRYSTNRGITRLLLADREGALADFLQIRDGR